MALWVDRGRHAIRAAALRARLNCALVAKGLARGEDTPPITELCYVSLGRAHRVMLRPMTWVTEQQASVGNDIPISIPGLHLVGIGRVLSVTSCPEIAE